METSLERALKFINPLKTKHILEFGVATGYTMRILKKNKPENTQLIGFDTFTGLPEDWVDSKGLVSDCIKGKFTRNGNPPNIPGVIFYKGLFEDTIDEYLKKYDESIGLIHIDCDLYSSTVTIFEKLNHKINSGVILVFDEWAYGANDKRGDEHEKKAFYEWVDKYNKKYEFIEFNGKDCRDKKIVKILN